ncbi:MAG: ATP-binding protein [Bacteroidales bacterium]|nr:ATP-binding protein [Bacteroidales bacterium]
MNVATIYTVVLEQQELLSTEGGDFVRRDETDFISLDSRLAQVVIGVRRSGKSTLCHMALRDAGVKYGYVNFDDDRLASLKVEDLNLVLEALYRVYGNDVRYLFFDEIQNVEGWHLFVNRLLRQGLHLVITGSNARLLSSELATHLTGRYNEIRLYPFSFKDFCVANGIRTDSPTTKNIALLKNTLNRYLLEGGFPEMNSLSLSERNVYVGSLIDAIITKDIASRFRLRNISGLKTLAHHLINNAGQVIQMNDLGPALGIGSDKTVRQYLDYLSQAFLLLPLTKFSYKSSERLRNSKAYIVDTGMQTYRPDVLSSENFGWRLENVVLLELQRRNAPLRRDVFYYRPASRAREVDFVVAERGNVVELIQVSYDISQPKTLSRELGALVEASKKTGCKNLTLVAGDASRKERVEGLDVSVVSTHEWLLENHIMQESRIL